MLQDLFIALLSGAAGAYLQHWLIARREVAQVRVGARWKQTPRSARASASSERAAVERAVPYLLIHVENVGKRPVLLERLSLAVAGDRVYPLRREELSSSSDMLDERLHLAWPHRLEANQQLVLLARVERVARAVQQRRGRMETELAVRLSTRRTAGFYESDWLSFAPGRSEAL